MPKSALDIAFQPVFKIMTVICFVTEVLMMNQGESFFPVFNHTENEPNHPENPLSVCRKTSSRLKRRL